jgi:RHS repeat-associated protein
VVASSGDLDGITVFYYDGQGIIETRDGSGNLVNQFVRGLRYIDEVVMVRVKGEGELYVHQAEGDQGGSPKDWNVVGLTDLGGRLVERYVYRPYGEVTVHQLGGYGDYDGDGDVDANDRGEITGLTCGGSNPSGACRVLDLDFDNDCDSSDETVFDALPHTGTVIHPARRSSLLGQPFAHQGLFLDSEIASYPNRARQYGPAHCRFAQRDPLGVLVLPPRTANEPHAYQYLGNGPIRRLDPHGLCFYGDIRTVGSEWQEMCMWPGCERRSCRRCQQCLIVFGSGMQCAWKDLRNRCSGCDIFPAPAPSCPPSYDYQGPLRWAFLQCRSFCDGARTKTNCQGCCEFILRGPGPAYDRLPTFSPCHLLCLEFPDI